MAVVPKASRAVIANRVIEVLEYFDDEHREATVMQIARRYGRPQSSTSDLLAGLVETGLLYRDHNARTFRPTPRMALLGLHGQPKGFDRSGLHAFTQMLARSTRQKVGLFGIVGQTVQMFHLATPKGQYDPALPKGSSSPLAGSAIGQLLLSTLPEDQLALLLRRLNAEARDEERFDPAELTRTIARFGAAGHATGAFGFLPDHSTAAVLVPGADSEKPLAIACCYPDRAAIDPAALLRALDRCQDAYVEEPAPHLLMAM